MIIEAFVICDAATDSMGKLNILGSYDSIHTNCVPAMVQNMVFALRMRFRQDEQGAKDCEIVCIDYDGKTSLPPFKAKLDVRVPYDRDSIALNFILNVNGVQFAKQGKYRIDMLMDGVVKASLPLDVRIA